MLSKRTNAVTGTLTVGGMRLLALSASAPSTGVTSAASGTPMGRWRDLRPPFWVGKVRVRVHGGGEQVSALVGLATVDEAQLGQGEQPVAVAARPRLMELGEHGLGILLERFIQPSAPQQLLRE